MPANLVFATSELLEAATQVAGVAATAINYPNFTGYRDLDIRNVSNGSEQELTYAISRTQKIDYFIFARANRFKLRGSTRLVLQGKLGAGAYSNYAGTVAGLASKTLYGVRGEDAIFTADLANSDGGIDQTLSRNFDALNLRLSDLANTVQRPFNRIFAGSWIDIDRDPERPARVRKAQNNINPRETAWQFQFTWKGLTDAVLYDFINRIAARRNNGVMMYTKTYHEVLLGFRCVHAFPLTYSTSRRMDNTNDITITFEELL